MIIHNVAQRSEEWFALRLGRATASRAKDIRATGRGGKGIGPAQIRYRNELVVERLNGVAAERPFSGNQHTQRGVDLEQEAVSLWEAKTGTLVMPCGFVTHDTLMAGCSPDGIVYGGGLTIVGTLEVKCRIQALHYETLRAQEIVEKADRLQVLHSVWLTGAQFGIYLSYCPTFKDPDERLVAIEFQPTELELAEHRDAVTTFLESVDTEEQSRKPVAQQLEESLDG